MSLFEIDMLYAAVACKNVVKSQCAVRKALVERLGTRLLPQHTKEA